MSLASTIIPKSDQLNADDLIAGPRVIRITEAKLTGDKQQPVSIYFEDDNGRPYKPNLSMRRALILTWGQDETTFTGRTLCLFRNPLVSYAGEPCGGIQISHMSNIKEPVSLSLTERRGKRKPFHIEPIPDGEEAAKNGMKALQEWFTSIPLHFKTFLKPTLDAKWKIIAAEADKTKA
jgi:hypothetical protein